jgi:DNA-binding NarL/FixJ family response regulator
MKGIIMIKVIIIDDQDIVVEGIKAILEADPDIQVVGSTNNSKEAVQLCEKFSPDLVLMDLMPLSDGIEGTRLIKASFPEIKVLVLTTFSDEHNILKAIENGANGYILKDIKPEELRYTVKNMVRGLSVIHQNVFQTLLKQVAVADNTATQAGNGGSNGSNGGNGGNGATNSFKLTEQELAVIQLIVFGKSNREIAAEIHLSEGRIRNIITSILEKLQLKDRTQLAVFAVKNKLI